MDAYDIFKKLSKGLSFKYRVLGVKKDQNNYVNTASINNTEYTKIKSDSVVKEEQNFLDHEYNEKTESSENSSEEEQEIEKNDLQLVEGVTIGKEKRKKKHKEKSEDLLKKLDLEEQNKFRNEHGIKVVGRHIPAALASFNQLLERYDIKPGLVETVTNCGYSEPTPIQRQAIPCMLEDRQILACAPTGSGKTAAFLLPLFHVLGGPSGGPRALILCPTRELAQQIYREALRLSAHTQLRCSVLRNMKESKVKEREATFKKSDIVISTPNRLCYLLNREDVSITLERVHWLVIDEADKLFEGSIEEQDGFRLQLDQVLSACSNKQRRVAMYSATHTPAVAKWCRHNLRGLINITVGLRNAATDTVDQELLYCGNENGKLVAFRQLVQNGLKPPVLVFVQSKDRAKQLFKEFIYDGINVDVIHADRTQAQRDNVVRSFRVGRIWVLICTELMGRGIDFRGVSLVVNYDFPPTAISYIHRIGRAGRAGQRGKAVTFFTQDDIANLRSIATVMKQSGCQVPEYMLKLKNDPSKRKKVKVKAPHRDKISTILEKRLPKRKLEEAKTASSKEDETPKKKTKPNPKLDNKQSKHVKQKVLNEKASKTMFKKEQKKVRLSKKTKNNLKQKHKIKSKK